MPVALQSHDEIKAKADTLRSKRQAEQEKRAKEKKDWYGLVYCSPGGYCSVDDTWLGLTDEIIPYLKKQGIDGENISSVLQAVEDFREEQKNQENLPKAKNEKPSVTKTQSCHLATKKSQRHISIPPPKTNRATFEDNPENLASQHPFFKKDPKLLALMESLIKRDIGIPTIHRELNKHGYAVPYRTVGRWVAQMRSRELL